MLEHMAVRRSVGFTIDDFLHFPTHLHAHATAVAAVRLHRHTTLRCGHAEMVLY